MPLAKHAISEYVTLLDAKCILIVSSSSIFNNRFFVRNDYEILPELITTYRFYDVNRRSLNLTWQSSFSFHLCSQCCLRWRCITTYIYTHIHPLANYSSSLFSLNYCYCYRHWHARTTYTNVRVAERRVLWVGLKSVWDFISTAANHPTNILWLIQNIIKQVKNLCKTKYKNIYQIRVTNIRWFR